MIQAIVRRVGPRMFRLPAADPRAEAVPANG
jgi:hypothetical protein